MKIRFTENADRDNDQLLAGIAAESPTAAAGVTAAIETTLGRLSSFPYLGATTDIPGVRLMVARPYPYLIFYAVEDDLLIVRNILHVRRQWPSQTS